MINQIIRVQLETTIKLLMNQYSERHEFPIRKDAAENYARRELKNAGIQIEWMSVSYGERGEVQHVSF